MYTSLATITNIKVYENGIIWFEFQEENKSFPTHCELACGSLSGYYKINYLLSKTKSKSVYDLVGKSVRIVDTEKLQAAIVAIGLAEKDKFHDVYGQEYPVKEKRIYKKYTRKIEKGLLG